MINKKGFTLIELMIAMTIFVLFTGIIINSYMNIVRVQREVNDYRIMYSEARQVFEKITSELRSGFVYYEEYGNYNSALDRLVLVSKDGTGMVWLGTDDKKVAIVEKKHGGICAPYYLNSSEVELSELKFFVSPAKNPFEYVDYNALQFQPKVTVYARFSKKMTNGTEYKVDLQTTVSERAYAKTITDLNSGSCPFSGFINQD